MDPIESINIKKDSTFAMLLAARQRNWEVYYMRVGDLSVADGLAQAYAHRLDVKDDPAGWFTLGEPETITLRNLGAILMRKDPPFNMEYIYATYVLDLAQRQGAWVINNPQALRDANEKFSTTWFPQCAAPTLVTRQAGQILEFLRLQKDIVLKPLDGMGGASIFRITQQDKNTNVIIETLTDHGRRFAIAQRFIPDISKGDKRILLINGEPVPYALARIPPAGETRGNLAVGGTGKGVALSERDLWICQQLAPELKQRGLVFVGIDVIGDYLTEINVTSPTCIRELDKLYNLDIAGQLMDYIDSKVS